MNKVGPHIQMSTGMSKAWAQVAPCVKQIDGTDCLMAAPPGAITIFRHYFPYEDIMRNGADVANEALGALGGFRPTYIELYNETSQGLGENCPGGVPGPSCGLMRYTQMHIEAAPVVHAYGTKLLGFSFSTWSHPQPAEIAYLDSVRWGDCDAIGIHEYWGPIGFTPANALWHREVHRMSSGHPPIIISECGRDGVEGANCYGAPKCGWVDQQVPADQYVGEVLQFDALISQDYYVEGANVFDAGPTPDWMGYDTDRITPALVGTGPVPPPEPAPTPPPAPWPGPGPAPTPIPSPPPTTPPKQVFIPWWARIPTWALLISAASMGLAAIVIADQEAGQA